MCYKLRKHEDKYWRNLSKETLSRQASRPRWRYRTSAELTPLIERAVAEAAAGVTWLKRGNFRCYPIAFVWGISHSLGLSVPS